MSDITRDSDGLQTRRETQPVVEQRPENRRGVRVIEFGRLPQVVFLERETTVGELVRQGYFSPNSEIFVNSEPATEDTIVRDGDAVVGVQSIKGA